MEEIGLVKLHGKVEGVVVDEIVLVFDEVGMVKVLENFELSGFGDRMEHL